MIYFVFRQRRHVRPRKHTRLLSSLERGAGRGVGADADNCYAKWHMYTVIMVHEVRSLFSRLLRVQ